MADTDLVTFGGLKNRLKGLINRKDLTDSLAGSFINETQGTLDRTLRIGPMERLVQVTMDGTTNAITVPPTYMEMIHLFTDCGTVDPLALPEWLQKPSDPGIPRWYVKMADKLLLRATPPAGTTVYLFYYASTDPLKVDTDSNVWSQSAGRALLFGAAEAAAIHFQDDDRADRYNAKFVDLQSQLGAQSISDSFSGGYHVAAPAVGDY